MIFQLIPSLLVLFDDRRDKEWRLCEIGPLFVNYFPAASYALSSVTVHVVAPCNDAALLAPSIWTSVLVVECAVNNFCFLDTILFHVVCIRGFLGREVVLDRPNIFFFSITHMVDRFSC